MTNTERTTKIADATWRTNDISLEDIRAYFLAFPGNGEDPIAGMISGEAGAKARGYWYCNEREMHAIYRSLEQHLRSQELRAIDAELDAFMAFHKAQHGEAV